MKKLLGKAAYITSMGLVIGQSGLFADDGFILQPKIQPTIKAVREASPEVESAAGRSKVVVQPSKTDSTPPDTSLVAQSEAVPSQARVQPQNMTVQQGTPMPPEPSQATVGHEADGLSWVKRGSLSASVSAVAKRAQPSPAAPSINTIEIATPATARAPQSSRLVEGSSAIAASGLNLDADVAKGTVPATTMQWQNSRDPAMKTVAATNAEANATNTGAVRAQLASKISKKILGESSPQRYLSSAGGSSLMGPAAVERELTEALARSEQLCRRGVFLSAREEAKAAQLQLARYVDSVSNSLHSEPRLIAAQVAMREASDFARPGAHKVLRELITAHDTPVLKDVDVSQAPPATLRQSYYHYAEKTLLEASQRHPWFSDVFYSLGRTYQAEADSKPGDDCEHLRALAVVYYRAASLIRPTNALATNQLGYVLLQLDRPAEAMTSLLASLDTKLDTPALQNLAEASRRVGDMQMQSWAISQITNLNRMNPQPQRRSPSVIELDNSTFAATTPVIPFSTSSESRSASLPSGSMR